MARSSVTAPTLRVGVVGCGKIAETHVPYIRKAGGQIVAVADVSSATGNALADRFAIQRVYRSTRDLLNVEQPDVVHVLTPPHTHADVAIEALQRGIHVLVEKPMAIHPKGAEAMVRAAASSGALLTVDHNRLFDPAMLAARQLVDSGRIGRVVGVESYQAGEASPRAWLDQLPGRGLGDLLPHPLYLQLAFVGRVRDVAARLLQVADAGEELRVIVEGESCPGVLTISTSARPQLNTLKIYGSEMTVEVNLNSMTMVRRRDYDVPKVIGKSLPNLDEAWQLVSQTARNAVDFVRGKVRYYPGMGTLIDGFYAAVREGCEPAVTPEQGAEVVRVTSAIWRALASGDSAPMPMLAGAEAR